jgi:hypothetical protein
MRKMIHANPQLSAIALLVKKFGKRIEGGGYEVEVTASEMMGMSPHGTFHEVPAIDRSMVKWVYYPNNTIDAEPGSWKDVTPESVTPKGELENGRPVQHSETDEPPAA